MNTGIVGSVWFALTFCITFSGCTALNQTYDQKKYFVEKRNSEVGKDINDVLSHYHPGFEPKLSKWMKK
jgi:hypothetical protein